MKIAIVVDHLRMGGAERVALDQAYQLTDDGHNITIVQFAGIANQTNPNYLTGELGVINKREIKLLDFSGNHFHQLKLSIKLLQMLKPDLLIVHSLRAAVILRIAKLLLNQKTHMTVSIHQLPELSAPLQRYKRFLYAQSGDRLFSCSFAMQEQWLCETKKNFLSRIFFRKEIELLRNGVYLGRLGSISKHKDISSKSNDLDSSIRIISLGRNVGWKRADILIKSFELISEEGAQLLVMRPEKNQELEDLLAAKFNKSVSFMYGKTIMDLIPRIGDVHLYPTDSGGHSQSSINIIEMACLGIPSVVSPEGGQCWPELLKLGLLVEVDWNKYSDVKNAIKSSSNLDVTRVLTEVRNLLSIEKNTSEHMNFVRNRT